MEPFFTVEFSSRDSEGIVNSGMLSFGMSLADTCSGPVLIYPLILGDISPPFVRIRDAPKLPLMTGMLWDVPSRGFVVNGEIVNFSGGGELPFALDTGAYTGELLTVCVLRLSSLLICDKACVPPEYMRAIYGSVSGSYLLDDGYWSVPCDAKLNVSMIIGCV